MERLYESALNKHCTVIPHVTEKLKLKVLQIEFFFLSVLHIH
jgi:hypothetical protein